MNKTLLLLALVLATSACSEKLYLKRTSYNNVPGWQGSDHSGAALAFAKSCDVILKKNAVSSLGPVVGAAGYWQSACNTLNGMKDTMKSPARAQAAKDFFEQNFTPLRATSSKAPDGLFTGYYEIELNGSKKRGGKFQYPLYRLPKNEADRCLCRTDIEQGRLSGKGLEIAWVDDPVRLFFLHIQGSGIIKLKEGGSMRVGYEGQNGQAYLAIGRYLIDKGYLQKEEVTAPIIKQWLYDNPDKAAMVMQQNPSYVYFKVRSDLDPNDGPVGAQNVPVTPFRTLAVDRRYIGYSAPLWLQTTLPALDTQPEEPFTQLLIAQDTGGAIRGAIRGDVFFGRGAYAEALAGHMKQRGNIWVLLPNELAANYEEEKH